MIAKKIPLNGLRGSSTSRLGDNPLRPSIFFMVDKTFVSAVQYISGQQYGVSSEKCSVLRQGTERANLD